MGMMSMGGGSKRPLELDTLASKIVFIPSILIICFIGFLGLAGLLFLIGLVIYFLVNILFIIL